MGCEAAGRHEPIRIGADGGAGGGVTAQAARTEARDDRRSPTEVDCSDVVGEDVVAATQ